MKFGHGFQYEPCQQCHPLQQGAAAMSDEEFGSMTTRSLGSMALSNPRMGPLQISDVVDCWEYSDVLR